MCISAVIQFFNQNVDKNPRMFDGASVSRNDPAINGSQWHHPNESTPEPERTPNLKRMLDEAEGKLIVFKNVNIY